MKRAALNKRQRKILYGDILHGKVLVAELKGSKPKQKSTRNRSLASVVSGKVARKYRSIGWISRKTGLSRKVLTKINDIGFKFQRKRERARFGDKVRDFLQRDDNSRAQPGKCDVKKTETGEKVQTRVLTDYMRNLYEKYLSENPCDRISFTTFCRLRPLHIQTTSFISRSSCLCTKHQNMALLIKTLRREGIDVSQSPETYLKSEHNLNDIEKDLPSEIKFSQWKRVKIEEKGRTKSVMKIVEDTVEKPKFMEKLKHDTAEFNGHVYRLHHQFEQIKILKTNLPDHEMVVHMDFAENYNCKSVEEIQSAYWNKTNVTLHPVVVYFKEGIELKHRSVVVVSNEQSHSAPTVVTFLNNLMPHLREIDPGVKVIHYWTDGPTSQYRNKTIFNMICNHKQTYGISARWNFYESGHGKGPCDGLGGITKRLADEAVNSGKVTIQDAKEFFQWAVESSMKSVKFMFIPSTECEETVDVLKSVNIKPVKGTFKLHAVVGLGAGKIAVNNVSCYCTTCLGGGLCDVWTLESLSTSAASDESHMKPSENSADVRLGFCVDSYVAAVYDNKWYIGKVLEIDEENDVEITFMKNSRGKFQWPFEEDITYVKLSDVLCKIAPPVPSSKSGRMFKISDDTLEQIHAEFEQWLSKPTS